MPVRVESDKRKEAWTAKVLLLCRGLIKTRTESKELGPVRYMECVSTLDEVNKAVRCVCLQWVTAGLCEETM